MIFLISSIAIFLLSALLALLFQEEQTKKSAALGGVMMGSLIGLIPAVRVLGGSGTIEDAWEGTLPGLTLRIGLDGLSAFFLLPILGLSALVACYAWGYLKGQKQLHATLPWFPLLVASMMGVVIAQDGFLFLIVWELMSLASFFLVTAEHERREVRHAGWVYLAATHLATAFLLVFFLLCFQQAGSFAFDDFATVPAWPFTGLLFCCALIGFCTKAGAFPLHIWLPHAHPAAPSYISALMSGVMIKTGIYGLLRACTFFPSPPLWCGELLVGVGVASAVLGVLYALMQHDLKKLLAYHSVENIGIILIGIGLGLIGRSQQYPLVEILGFGGALFHVVNHAMFKGLLFLGAGNILHATHRRRLDQLGGLIRRMPITGVTFLVAAAAICGLPPFNGFISEWLIYIGLFEGAKAFAQAPFFFAVVAIVGIAFAGGLAVTCFTKVVGGVFLGSPRVAWEQPVHEGRWQQSLPMGVLAFCCLLLGIAPQLLSPWLMTALAGLGVGTPVGEMAAPLATLWQLSCAVAIPIGLLAIGLLVRYWFIMSKRTRIAPTWDCGFAQPTPRMQYTAASYAEPLGTFFRFLLKPTIHFQKPEGTFPARASFEDHVDDLAERTLFGPLTQRIVRVLTWIRRRQRNQVPNYLAYIFATLLLLLLWEVWIGI